MSPQDLHPLEILTPEEINAAVKALKDSLPDVQIVFKRIERHEPPKKTLIPYLEAERLGEKLPSPPPRLVKVMFRRLDNGKSFVSIIRLSPLEVLSITEIPSRYHPPSDKNQMLKVLDVILKFPEVKVEIEKLQLPEGYTVHADAWTFVEAESKDRPAGRRRYQGFLYVNETNHPGANYYSIPIGISPVVDGETFELVRLEFLPVVKDINGTPIQPWKKVKAIQHDQDLISEPIRTDLKPYHVVQPKGASFTVQGNLVEWQKWRFRVGFNTREGLSLQNVTYDGRNVFYRLSVPEMAISYGDPRKPYTMKQGFDAADAGWGTCANSLQLGCDCLGTIHYFDGFTIDVDGNPSVIKNAICLHEQDAGILHKHTNFFTGRTTLARGRELVLQMVCTIGNYDYVFNWILDQAAGVHLEVRSTGIISTAPIDNSDGLKYPWGTNIGSGVFAPNHQHVFCMRIDPAIDGYDNTVVYEDSVALPLDPINNPEGCGHVVEENVVKMSGHLDLDVSRSRVFKIRNDNVVNSISSRPVAYKLGLPATQMLLCNPSRPFYRKAVFATKQVWVTEYRDNELFPNGEFTFQKFRDDDILSWVDRKDTVESKDVVVWHSFGFTHNPRPEDFPIMPVEKVMISLKPSGFFEKNPALDVPKSTQAFNQSRLHSAVIVNGSQENGTSDCCN